MAFTMRLMDSFSQPERFIWHEGVFAVIIPNGTRTAYHPRASLSYLRTLLIPQLRLTRAGNISSHQPPPPPARPYDFYLAQLIHYGLDFHFETESAQRALEIQIRLERLHVPPGLMRLERELRREHERKQKRDRQDPMRVATKQQLGSKVDAAIVVDISDVGSKEKPALRTTHRRVVKRKRAKKEVMHTSDEDEAESFTDQTSSGATEDSGDESETIALAADRRHNTSSDSSNSSSSSSSSSAEDIPEVKHSESIHPGRYSISNESSVDADGEDTSSRDDPFLDKQDSKRIKMEKADEKDDSIFRSTREGAPAVVRRQLPPTEVKIRRIASQPDLGGQPFHSALENTNGGQSSKTTTFASTSKIAPRKPFVNPDKRPSWTIPVRSPSSSQRDTPKSVTFSQVQRETPTKVPEAEKTTFSSAIETPQRTLHRRTPSFSSDHSHTTPRRSILKKGSAPPSQNLIGGGDAKTEISVKIDRDSGASSSRPRKRKRRSETDRAFYVDFDGARETPDTPEDDADTVKPYITSDLVDGKPISSLGNNARTRALQASSQDHTLPPPKTSAGWMAVNSNSSRRQLRVNGDRKQHSAGDLNNNKVAKSKMKQGLKARANLSGKARNSFGTPNGYGYDQQTAFGLSGASGSRGGLVRAGAAF